MNYLEHTFPNGTILKTPEEILVIEKFNFIDANTYYKVKFSRTYNGAFCIDVLSKDGEPTIGMYLTLDTFLHLKYIECSLEKYNNLKAFF